MMVFSPSNIYAMEEDEETPRWAKVIKHGNRLFIHSLSLTPPPCGARIINHKDIIKGVSASNAIAFIDLYWKEKIHGRIFIRLYSDEPRAKRFMTMCSGEEGLTYKGTCMFSPSSVDEPNNCLNVDTHPNQLSVMYLSPTNSSATPIKSDISSPLSDISDAGNRMGRNDSLSPRPSITCIQEEPKSNMSLKADFNADSSTVTTSLVPSRRASKRKDSRVGSFKATDSMSRTAAVVTLKRRGTSKRSVREADICLLPPALLYASPNEIYFYFIMDGQPKGNDTVLGEVIGGMTILKDSSLQKPISNVIICDCGVAVRKWEKST